MTTSGSGRRLLLEVLEPRIALSGGDHPWQNTLQPLDANADTNVTPLDALIVINHLNTDGPGALPVPAPTSGGPPPYLDVSGDDAVTALDALFIINYLNNPSSSDVTQVNLEGDLITLQGGGATVAGRVVTITSAGQYSIHGTLNDGQVIVDTADEGTVELVLNGVNISCSTSAPLYIANADQTEIVLATGTQNHITDGTSYPNATTEDPNAAVFSHDDLIISGTGSLTVDAKFNNGIAGKDELTIAGGTLTVNAVNDGIKGRDSITIQAGTITVQAGGDGLQSSNDEDLAKGVVAIEGGTLRITAGADGIQGEAQVLIQGGSISVTSGGGSASSSSSVDSAKGIKSATDISINGGVIDVNSLDDALHSNNNVTIGGGTLTLASGDDGIHADAAITINAGNVHISKANEGIESPAITVNNGIIHLVTSDDGFNVSDGSGGGMAGGPGIGGPGGGNDVIDGTLNINGGYLVVNAQGDGLDSNGNINVTGGTIIVHGPTRNDNGALDCNGNFLMSGGFLIAVGSSGMAEVPDDSSAQEVLAASYGSAQAAGTMVHVESQDGTQILTFVPVKAYQSVVICAPLLKKGTTYNFYTGGSSTGTLADGLYSGGTYTPGTKLGSLTIA